MSNRTLGAGKVRPRISLSEELWAAVQAVSTARRIDPSLYIEEALASYMSSLDVVESAIQSQARFVEVSDMIRVLADFVVDHRGGSLQKVEAAGSM